MQLYDFALHRAPTCTGQVIDCITLQLSHVPIQPGYRFNVARTLPRVGLGLRMRLAHALSYYKSWIHPCFPHKTYKRGARFTHPLRPAAPDSAIFYQITSCVLI